MQQGEEDRSREDEFLRLFARSQRALHAYILAHVMDPNATADLLQETNIVLWKKFDEYQQGTHFLAWAREIARRSILHYRRTMSRQIATLDTQVLEELAVQFSNLCEPETSRLEALDGCLDKLNGGDRDLIMRRYQPGASVTVLAEKLDRPVNSVSHSLGRIRRTLAECMERKMRSGSQPSSV